MCLKKGMCRFYAADADKCAECRANTVATPATAAGRLLAAQAALDAAKAAYEADVRKNPHVDRRIVSYNFGSDRPRLAGPWWDLRKAIDAARHEVVRHQIEADWVAENANIPPVDWGEETTEPVVRVVVKCVYTPDDDDCGWDYTRIQRGGGPSRPTTKNTATFYLADQPDVLAVRGENCPGVCLFVWDQQTHESHPLYAEWREGMRDGAFASLENGTPYSDWGN